MAWSLNPFLTSWRSQVDRLFPARTRASEGTIGDVAHQKAGTSEHLPDSDGSVDAWDCDLNLLGSANPLGSAAEIAAMKKLIAEFQKQPQAQLWIFQRKIANRDVDNWRVRVYAGPSPHDHHCHFQSKSTRERQKYTGDLDKVFPALNKETDMPLTTADADLVIRRLLGTRISEKGPVVGIALQTILNTVSGDDVDEAAIAKAVLAGLDVKAIATAIVAALPKDQAKQVVNELSIRLSSAGG